MVGTFILGITSLGALLPLSVSHARKLELVAFQPAYARTFEDTADLPIHVKEANWLFSSSLKFMDRADGIKPRKMTFFSGNPGSSVNRVEFLNALDKLERSQEKFYVMIVRRQYMDPNVIEFPPAEKRIAENLIVRGFLAPTCPLVVGRDASSSKPRNTVSLSEAGDYVAYLISRWAQQSHHSSLQWSPSLEYLGKKGH